MILIGPRRISPSWSKTLTTFVLSILPMPRFSQTGLFQPWLLSNIVDTDTGKVPEGLHQFQVIERAGLRVGIIGLVEEYACFLLTCTRLTGFQRLDTNNIIMAIEL